MFVSKWCKPCPDTANLVLRIVIGITFFMHGSQKVLGWFGGGGLTNVVEMMTQMDMPLAVISAYVLSFVEFMGGIAVLLGCCTRLASGLLSIVMIVAIFKVHLKNGFFAPEGIELPFVILGGTLALFFSGCVKWGMDCMMCKK